MLYARYMCCLVSLYSPTVVSVHASVEQGRDATRERVRSWVEAELGRIRAAEYADVYFKWTATTFPPQPADLDRLRQEVGNLPDHPRAGELKRLSALQASAGAIQVNEAWIGSDGRWRVNYTFSQGGLNYLDAAQTGVGVRWQLIPDSLTIEDPRSPSGQSLDSAKATALAAISRLDSRGLGQVALVGDWKFHIADGAADDEWLIATEGANGRGQALLKWNDVKSEGSIVETKVKYAFQVSANMTRTEPTPEFEFRGRRLPRAMTCYSESTGVLPIRLELVEVRDMPSVELAHVVALPDPTSSDAVRGPLRVTKVNDYRPGVSQSIDAGGPIEVTRPLSRRNAPSDVWIRIAGWSSLALCVAGIVWVRLRRVA